MLGVCSLPDFATLSSRSCAPCLCFGLIRSDQTSAFWTEGRGGSTRRGRGTGQIDSSLNLAQQTNCEAEGRQLPKFLSPLSSSSALSLSHPTRSVRHDASYPQHTRSRLPRASRDDDHRRPLPDSDRGRQTCCVFPEPSHRLYLRLQRRSVPSEPFCVSHRSDFHLRAKSRFFGEFSINMVGRLTSLT